MSAPDKSNGAIPRVGVTLAAVERFQREVARARGARRPWLLCFGATTRGLTTDAVNKLAMAHLTGAQRCAYASLLDTGDATLVGEATVFVSHAWAMPFDALVAALRDFDREERAREPARPPYFWLDLLVNDQFAAPSRPFEWWQTVFRENVRRIGHTLVVLEWERPLPLQRVWCVWEMFCAASAVAEASEAGARDGGAASGAAPPRRAPLLELALPPASRAAFEHALTSDFESISAKLCRIDLRDADAFHGGSGPGSCGRILGGCPAVAADKPCPNDKAQILGAIERAPGGVDGVTKVVIGALREWMVEGARRTLAAIPGAKKRAGSDLQYYLACFLEDCGRLAEAEVLLRETAEVLRRTLGAEAENTLVAIDKLAGVLMVQGKLEESEPLFLETLGAQRRTLGDAHPSTLASINNLGSLLQYRGDLDGAEMLLREALDALRRTLGDTHPGTLANINNLGFLLKARGDLDGAEKLYREALDARRLTLGDEHPNTLTSMGNLGDLLYARGDLGSAEKLYREALDARRLTLGDGHPNTLSSVHNLGALLFKRGDLAEAATLLREALAGNRRVLGDAHKDTLITASSLAKTLHELGDLADAVPLYCEVLAAQRLTVGADSNLTLKLAHNLADVLVSLGDAASVAEAAPLANEALAGLRRNLGEAHASTLVALRVRGRVLTAQGDLAGAADALRASLDGFKIAAVGDAAEQAAKSARELAAVLHAQGNEAGAAAVEASVA